MLALHHCGLGLRTSRWLIEIGCAGVGWALGGPLGALTVLLVTLAAPIIAALLPVVRSRTTPASSDGGPSDERLTKRSARAGSCEGSAHGEERQ